MAIDTPGQLPRPAGLVTDGGMETDLIFNRGVRLPDFAAFPLLADPAGRALLADYYGEYATIAASAGAGLLLESATWRANPDWGTRLGYSADQLAQLNTEAITLLAQLRDRYRASIGQIVISGMIGPRGDGYRPGARIDPDEAADYHRPQIETFAAAGADQVSALTLTDPGEAIGITRAARAAGLPVTISFTVETDGRLPDGTTLAQAITDVDAAAEPDYFLVNCAHPQHIAGALADPGDWRDRIHGVRYNASTRSHAELDEATELDRGDLDLLAAGHQQLRQHLQQLRILGGCCGTDARHVARLWQQP